MKLFFGKNVQKFCVSFIEQNIGEVKEQKVDKVASGCNEDVNKDELVTNEEKEKEEKEEEENDKEGLITRCALLSISICNRSLEIQIKPPK